MRPHPVYLLGELLAKNPEPPDSVAGDTSPRHAWREGYLAAITAMADAMEPTSARSDVLSPPPVVLKGNIVDSATFMQRMAQRLLGRGAK